MGKHCCHCDGDIYRKYRQLSGPRPPAVEPRRFDLRVENGRIAGNVKTVEVRQDDAVELKWSADHRTIVHLHGYDIEVTVNPGQAQVVGVSGARKRTLPDRRAPMETATRSWSTSKCIRGSRA